MKQSSQPGQASPACLSPTTSSWADVYLAGLRVDRGGSTANKDNSKGTDTKGGTALPQTLARYICTYYKHTVGPRMSEGAEHSTSVALG